MTRRQGINRDLRDQCGASRLAAGWLPEGRMVRTLVCNLWLCSVFSFTVRAAGPDGMTAAEPWFDAVRAPFRISAEQGVALTGLLYEGLRIGSLSDLPAGLATDTSPRLVCLSLSPGDHSATVYYGAGTGLRPAISAAFSAAVTGGVSARWLKLDIVQRVYRHDAFVLREQAVPMPSLFGIAFDAVSRLAFLPEQLISNAHVDTYSRLDIRSIEQPLAAAERWSELGRWNAITSVRRPQRVYFFESQSFFAAGTEATCLFRGHPLARELRRADLASTAARGGAFLLRACADDGAFRVNFPKWETAPDGTVPLRDHAGGVLVLITLHEATGAAAYQAAAERAAGHLLASMRPFGTDPRVGCLVEDYRVLLDSNAMGILALLRLRAGRETHELDGAIARLARYLLQQIQADGRFVCERVYPSGNISLHTSLPVSALGTLALLRLYEETGGTRFLEAARKTMASLLRTHVTGREMDDLPLDAWFAQAVDAYYTFTRDASLVTLAERIALGLVAAQTRRPVLPDYMGSVNNHPSATLAAVRTRALVAVARLLDDAGRDEAARSLLAAVELGLAFQLQAQITPPTAMYLPTPGSYLGAFRDHCLDYGFALHCQVSQILSLLETSTLLDRIADGEFPPDAAVSASIAAARAAALEHALLPKRLSDQIRALGGDGPPVQ